MKAEDRKAQCDQTIVDYYHNDLGGQKLRMKVAVPVRVANNFRLS